MSRPTQHHKLEVVIRIKDHDGWTRSEWIFRDGRVELRSYWPNGQLEAHKETDMETFYAAFKERAREAVPA